MTDNQRATIIRFGAPFALLLLSVYGNSLGETMFSPLGAFLGIAGLISNILLLLAKKKEDSPASSQH